MINDLGVIANKILYREGFEEMTLEQACQGEYRMLNRPESQVNSELFFQYDYVPQFLCFANLTT